MHPNMTREAVARLIGKNETQVDSLVRDDPTFPKPIMCDGRPMWHGEEVDFWLGTRWLRSGFRALC